MPREIQDIATVLNSQRFSGTVGRIESLPPDEKREAVSLVASVVEELPARTCGKWPILRKAASLLSGNLTRTPGPDLLVGPFQGDFLSVSSYQCTFG
jgi:hypothetical protein